MVKIKPTLCSEIVKYSNQTGFKIESKIYQDFTIECYTSLLTITKNSVVFCKNDKFLIEFDKLKELNVLVICCESQKLRDSGLNYIITDRPRDLYFSIADEFIIKETKNGISDKASILTKDIEKNVFIGDFTFINENVKIGNNVKIYDNVSIICPCEIGDNTIIFSGVKIGADGFGMYKDSKGLYHQIPHCGGVKIGNNVSIGANSCIDRGTIDDTIIFDNAKIHDNCIISHNAIIGKNALVIGESIVCGSAKIGNNTYLAPGTIIKNGVSVGENSFIDMGGIVKTNIDSDMLIAPKQERKMKLTDEIRKMLGI